MRLDSSLTHVFELAGLASAGTSSLHGEIQEPGWRAHPVPRAFFELSEPIESSPKAATAVGEQDQR